MKRPKVVRRRYTQDAWKRKEDQCIKALNRCLEANKEILDHHFKTALIKSPLVYKVEIHPKLQSAIDQAKSNYITYTEGGITYHESKQLHELLFGRIEAQPEEPKPEFKLRYFDMKTNEKETRTQNP